MKMKLNVTKEVILEKLLKINSNKSPGPENLQPRVIKELAHVLVEPLFIIFVQSIELSKVPTGWRLAWITAIFKNKGSKHDPCNYRPISLTSIVCRILESIVKYSIIEYLEINSILTNKQFGFLERRAKSCNE